MENKKCEKDELMYMSNPPQYKCKNCGRFWYAHKETPFCHSKEEKCVMCKTVDDLAPSGSYCADHKYKNPPQESWEKEFETLWNNSDVCECWEDHKNSFVPMALRGKESSQSVKSIEKSKIKSFIKNLLSSEKAQLIQEIIEKLPKEERLDYSGDTIEMVGKVSFSKGFNQALSEIKQTLNQSKEVIK